jgi:hypothetical protein
MICNPMYYFPLCYLVYAMTVYLTTPFTLLDRSFNIHLVHTVRIDEFPHELI